jgi:hypothetical protein
MCSKCNALRRWLHHFASATVLTCGDSGGGCHSPVRPQPADWRNRLFSNGIWSADRRYDPRADCSHAGGRLAKTRPEFSGATALAQSAAGRYTALGWPAPQGKSRRGSDSLDVKESRRHSSDRRCPQRSTGKGQCGRRQPRTDLRRTRGDRGSYCRKRLNRTETTNLGAARVVWIPVEVGH